MVFFWSDFYENWSSKKIGDTASVDHFTVAILLKGWILPIGEASVGKGLRLQPAQQACFIEEPTSLAHCDLYESLTQPII